MEQEEHEMVFVRTDEAGFDVFFCPICYRVRLYNFMTMEKRTEVEGDPNAIHTGGRGGLSVSSPRIIQDEDKSVPDVFQKFIEGLDLDGTLPDLA